MEWEKVHGTINVFNNLTIYAYGGAGGSGGHSTQGSGAGGYPAAGIGGGGAGGAGSTCCTGAGGYSGGSGKYNPEYISVNGLNGGVWFNSIGSTEQATWGSGGGYYKGSLSITEDGDLTTKYGGMSGSSWWTGHMAGNGGTAGKGGNVKVSSQSKVYAFNGNRYTDGTDYKNGENEAVIYYQNGINIERGYTLKQNEGATSDDSSYAIFYQTNPKSIVAKTGYVNHYFDDKTSRKIVTINELLTNVDLSNQGVGSGAGYVEVSNGTYIVDESMN